MFKSDKGPEILAPLDRTLICGTHRAKDLIPTFIGALAYVAIPEELIPEYAMGDYDSVWWDSEEADILLQCLFDILGDYAPNGYYFGAIDGDGSDYGYWSMPDMGE